MGCPLVSVVAFLSFCKLCHAAGEVQSQIQSVTIVYTYSCYCSKRQECCPQHQVLFCFLGESGKLGARY